MANSYSGECAYCGKRVNALEGALVSVGSRRAPAHIPCMTERRPVLGGKVPRPLSHVSPLAWELQAILSQACHRIVVAGSIRRGAPEVSDIELVAIPKVETVETGAVDLFKNPEVEEYNMLWKAIDAFAPNYVKGEEADKSRSLLWPLRRKGEFAGDVKVDVFTATQANWGLILAIRTGPAEFSKRLVTALARSNRPSHGGFIRNADGVRPKWVSGGVPYWDDAQKEAMPKVEAREERDVFDLARIQMLPANARAANPSIR